MVVETVKSAITAESAVSTHLLQDTNTSTEVALSPSLGWLSPTRVSFSKDLTLSPPKDIPQGCGSTVAVDGQLSPSTVQLQSASSNKSKEQRPGHDARDSMSEFEFAMSFLESESTNGKQMIAADELFFKGKLLPLYVPQYISHYDSEKSNSINRSEQEVRRSTDVNQRGELINNIQTSSSKWPCNSPRAGARNAVNNSVMASMSPQPQGPPKCRELYVVPGSPKTPRCSTKLKELLGLKRSLKSHVIPAPGSAPLAAQLELEQAAVSSCKSSSRKSKLKSGGSSPSTLSKAKRLFCRSDDGSREGSARNSTSEPLLGDQLSGISFQPHHHQQYNMRKIMLNTHVSNTGTSLCGNAGSSCNQLAARIQRSNKVSDHVVEPDQGSKYWIQHRPSNANRASITSSKLNKGSIDNARKSSASTATPQRRSDATMACFSMDDTTLKRPLIMSRSINTLPGSGDSSPARMTSSGAVSPAGSCSGHWSPGRHSAAALMQGCNSTSRGWGSMSPIRHSISQAPPILSRAVSELMMYSPGRHSIGGVELMSSCEYYDKAGSGRCSHRHRHHHHQSKLVRARSLERSSSYSPKSLQRKYDHLKAMRQREGSWRSLERSSSYNNNSVQLRVAPVLNVPMVCIRSSSKSSSSTASSGSFTANSSSYASSNSSGGSSTGGGFGSIANFFSSSKNNHHQQQHQCVGPKLAKLAAQDHINLITPARLSAASNSSSKLSGLRRSGAH